MSAPREIPSLVFLRYAVDGEGHAYQLLELGEERLELYPVLDPVSLEHALEVERTILPAVVDELYEADPAAPALASLHAFVERFGRVQQGDSETIESVDAIEARVIDVVRASINDHTSPADVRRRAFGRFYQHAICENDRYREKARQSLERLVARLSRMHG